MVRVELVTISKLSDGPCQRKSVQKACVAMAYVCRVGTLILIVYIIIIAHNYVILKTVHLQYNTRRYYFRVGANLEVANHVIIIHPYCPANVSKVSIVPLAQAQTFEQQAIGRVLRFPQTKDVHVYRFYSLGTPEEELYTHWGWAGLSQMEHVC